MESPRNEKPRQTAGLCEVCGGGLAVAVVDRVLGAIRYRFHVLARASDRVAGGDHQTAPDQHYCHYFAKHCVSPIPG